MNDKIMYEYPMTEQKNIIYYIKPIYLSSTEYKAEQLNKKIKILLSEEEDGNKTISKQ